jgi:hypothetical protein
VFISGDLVECQADRLVDDNNDKFLNQGDTEQHCGIAREEIEIFVMCEGAKD